MNSLRKVTLCLLLPVLVATGRALWAADAPSANAAPATPGRIVILGDSITAGYGLDPSHAYPALLQEKITATGLPYTVVNAGVSGDTTAGGLRRLDWTLSRPTAVLIVALGGNDGLRGISPRQTEENLTGILQRARAKFPAIKVIIAGMEMPANMGPDFVAQFRAVFPRVAEAGGAALVPFLLEGVGGVAALNQPDLIHPTAEGQKRIAENVWTVLRKTLEAAARP
jgi:acyl-CoA thioesterase-1